MAAVAIGPLLTSPAQAAVFVTDWDPPFNAQFSIDVGIPNVGWRGRAFVSVDNACLIPSTIQVAGVCGPASLDSVSLVFYSGLPANVIGSVIQFAPLPAIDEISIDANGVVDGIDLVGDVPVSFLNLSMFPPTADANLVFSLATISLSISAAGAGYTQAVYKNEVPPVVSWRVPEPAPITLSALALLGLACTRRRGG